MSRGFLMFAFNNHHIDYASIALCNALMIRHNHPDAAVSLVTNLGTLRWLRDHRGIEFVDKCFDEIIVDDTYLDSGTRRFHDTLSTSHELPWHNGTRSSAYSLSPYDETILLDCDYLICDDNLKHCWGSASDLMMNSEVVTLNHELPHTDEQRLEPFGIPMYWATCVYFRKSPYAEVFFNTVDHVKDNYEYYQLIYRFPGTMFRNDYAFSIAAHIMSQWEEGEIDHLPIDRLLTSFDCDELLEITAPNDLLFLVNDTKERWKFGVSRIEGMSVHVMNKFSLGRQLDDIIELYRGLDATV